MPRSRGIIFIGREQAELQEINVPDPEPGQFLVKTRVSLISTGTECICFRAESDPGSHWDNWVKHPFTPGYSNVGEVIVLGKNVKNVKTGDRVFTCQAHREYYSVGENEAFNIIPDGISDEEASWSKLATIAQTGVRRAELNLGDTVAIIGLGPLGQLITQYSKISGCERILAIDPLQDRLDVASQHGATHIFRGSAADAVEFVQKNSDGELADVAFDVTGHFAVFPMVLKLVRRFGTVMLVGDSPHPLKQHLEHDLITRQLQIRGSHNEMLTATPGKWDRPRQIELLYRYIERGQMLVKDMISQVQKPEDAQAVYKNLLNDRSGTMGVLFDWR